MARGINKVICIGNLGKDPELKQVGSSQVVNCSIACTESYKDKAGVRQTRTEWVNLCIWGAQATIVESYAKKGSRLYIEGSLRTRKWEKDGTTHYSTEVMVNQLELLDGKQDRQQEDSSPGRTTNEEEELPF